MERDGPETAAAAVVIPVNADQVGRFGPIGIDGAERRDARLRRARRIGELGEVRQPRSRAPQPLRGPVAGSDIGNRSQDILVIHSPRPSLHFSEGAGAAKRVRGEAGKAVPVVGYLFTN